MTILRSRARWRSVSFQD
jgi:hypothetical protein